MTREEAIAVIDNAICKHWMIVFSSAKKRLKEAFDTLMNDIENCKRLESEIENVKNMFQGTVEGCNVLLGEERSGIKEKVDFLRVARDATNTNDAYSVGMRNGLELARAVFEDEDPVYKSVIPIKPKSKVRQGANSQIQHFCGECTQMLHRKSWRFCPNCGMEIDWHNDKARKGK